MQRRDERVPISLEIQTRHNGDRRTFRMDSNWLVPDVAGWERVVAQVPEFACVAKLGHLDVKVPFNPPAAWRPVPVPRKDREASG